MKPGSPPPPPVFRTVPRVESIRRAESPGTYLVALREDGCEAQQALFTVQRGPIRVVTPDWDIFWGWPGDANSVRQIVGQITALHDQNATAASEGEPPD